MPNILEYPLQISLSYGLIPVCTHLCNRTPSVFSAISGKVIQSIYIFLKSPIIQANYTLQKSQYPQKHFAYSCEVLKSKSNINKSHQKEEKALAKHYASSLLTIYSGLFQAVSRLILMP
jgi:hypothetical protein